MLKQSAFDQNPLETDFRPAPIDPSWILSGKPQARSRTIADGGLFATAMWDCTAGSFVWHYAADEAVYILEGEAVITDAAGVVRTMRPGDAAVFAGGDTLHWTVPHYVRKFAVWGGSTRAVARYVVAKAGAGAGRMLGRLQPGTRGEVQPGGAPAIPPGQAAA